MVPGTMIRRHGRHDHMCTVAISGTAQRGTAVLKKNEALLACLAQDPLAQLEAHNVHRLLR